MRFLVGTVPQLGAHGVEILDRCRIILRRAGEPRMGASLTTRRAELVSALVRATQCSSRVRRKRTDMHRHAQTRTDSQADTRARTHSCAIRQQ
eukprot:COSAG03_NODE_2684_length_2527_cov_15.089786_1_plen_93_part_00